MFECCRYCGSSEVHTQEYGKPTFNCAKHLREENSELRREAEKLAEQVEGLEPERVQALVDAAWEIVWASEPKHEGSLEYRLKVILEKGFSK